MNFQTVGLRSDQPLRQLDRLSITQVLPAVRLAGDAPLGERTARLRRISKPERLTWVDQVRWVAVLLVIVGHFLGLYRERSALADVLSNFIYLFHMPVLVLLAGWAARDGRPSAGGLGRIAEQLLAPLIIFQVLITALEGRQVDQVLGFNLTEPAFGLWFLVALTGWRLLQPWFLGCRWPALAAAVLALFIGINSEFSDFLALSRLWFFFPFFLAGPWLIERICLWRRQVLARVGAATVLTLAFLSILSRHPEFDRRVFLGAFGYDSLSQGVASGMGHRISAWIIGFILAICFCLVVPGRPGTPTRIGQKVARAGRHTLYPYLLHLPLTIALRPLAHIGPPNLGAALFFVLALLVAFVLSSPLLQVLCHPLVEPGRLLRRLASGLARPGPAATRSSAPRTNH